MRSRWPGRSCQLGSFLLGRPSSGRAGRERFLHRSGSTSPLRRAGRRHAAGPAACCCVGALWMGRNTEQPVSLDDADRIGVRSGRIDFRTGGIVESGHLGRPESAVSDRFATAAAYAVAGAVHLLTAGLFIGSLMMIVLRFDTFIQPLLGMIPLGLALALRPRLGRLAPDLPVLREADAPALFALLHRTADSAGVRRVDTVQLTAEFDMRVTSYGVLRRRCLVLGLPLWSAYSPQQRIAAVTQALGEGWSAQSSVRPVRRLGPQVGDSRGAHPAAKRCCRRHAERGRPFSARGRDRSGIAALQRPVTEE